jgi:hypothetical protein
MPRDFFDPTPEQQNIVLVGAVTLHMAVKLIESCEYCHPDDAEIPFDNILDRVTGSDPSVTDYILEPPAKCAPTANARFWKRLSSNLSRNDFQSAKCRGQAIYIASVSLWFSSGSYQSWRYVTS